VVEDSTLDEVGLTLRALGEQTYGEIFFPDNFAVNQRYKTFIDFGLIQVRGFDEVGNWLCR
jgi:hypothetical protein